MCPPWGKANSYTDPQRMLWEDESITEINLITDMINYMQCRTPNL